MLAGRGDFYGLREETLALTKMNWRNDGPYTRTPVTLEYADALAQAAKWMPRLDSRTAPCRAAADRAHRRSVHYCEVVADLDGETSNHLFDTLADWDRQLSSLDFEFPEPEL